MMYHQNVSCNEPGHRAGRVRKARSTLIVINSNTMERLPFTRNGSGQQPNKLRDPKRAVHTNPSRAKNTKKIKQGKKERKRKRTGVAAAERGTNLVFPFAYFYFFVELWARHRTTAPQACIATRLSLRNIATSVAASTLVQTTKGCTIRSTVPCRVGDSVTVTSFFKRGFTFFLHRPYLRYSFVRLLCFPQLKVLDGGFSGCCDIPCAGPGAELCKS